MATQFLPAMVTQAPPLISKGEDYEWKLACVLDNDCGRAKTWFDYGRFGTTWCKEKGPGELARMMVEHEMALDITVRALNVTYHGCDSLELKLTEMKTKQADAADEAIIVMTRPLGTNFSPGMHDFASFELSSLSLNPQLSSKPLSPTS